MGILTTTPLRTFYSNFYVDDIIMGSDRTLVNDTYTLLGLDSTQYAPFDHKHEQYIPLLQKDSLLFSSATLTDGTNYYTPDLIAQVNHKHTQYVPTDESVIYTRKLKTAADGVAPSDLAVEDHNHDDRYIKRYAVMDNALSLVNDVNGVHIEAKDLATADHNHDQHYLFYWDEFNSSIQDITGNHIASDAVWLKIGDVLYSKTDFSSFAHDHGKLYPGSKEVTDAKLLYAALSTTTINSIEYQQLGTVGSTDKVTVYDLGPISYKIDATNPKINILNTDQDYLQSYVGADYPESYIPKVKAFCYSNANSDNHKYTLSTYLVEGYTYVGQPGSVLSLNKRSDAGTPIVLPIVKNMDTKGFNKVYYGIQIKDIPADANAGTPEKWGVEIVGLATEYNAQSVIKYTIMILY
jgi:hypothetical protein